MTEYLAVVLGKSVSYTGYFDFAQLWKMVRDYAIADMGMGHD